MSLKALVDAIQVQLQAYGVSAPVYLGAKALPTHGAPPRIVFIARGGPASAPEKIAGARALRTRNLTVQAHIWGKDYAAAEALLNSTVAAVHAVAHGSYEFQGESDPEGDDEHLAMGEEITANFTFRIPVTAPPHQTATITSTTQTEQLE